MKKDLTLPTLASLVALLAFSSVGATYAWYQYNANVIIDYNGTSIGSSTVFEVGLVSENPLVGYEDYGLVREEIDGKDVYWCSSEVTTNISKYYLNSNGYATNYLNGVTSGKFVENEHFSLKRNPLYVDNYVYEDDGTCYYVASKENYIHFGLVFKVNIITPEGMYIDQTSGVSLRVANLDSDGDLKKSVRMHFSNGDESFIFNPSSRQDGFNYVGGILDLNNDGVYDSQSTRHGEYELVYGEYEKLEYANYVVTDGEDPFALSGNGNSFLANHKNGVIPVDLDETVFSKAEYLGINSVIEQKKRLASTDSSGLAFLDMDIYLEGWDSSFVDAEMDHMFDLGLEFECK